MRRISLGDDHALPTPPAAVADAVELWARQYGRHATMKYVPLASPPCWSVNLSLKPDDPALRPWQEGRASHKPTEGVLLIEWDAEAGEVSPITGQRSGAYRPVDLEEYGPTGVVELLEKGNTWSGRGEFGSLAEAVVVAATRSREEREKIKARQRQWARDYAGDVRRQYLKIPFLPVGVALGTEVTNDA